MAAGPRTVLEKLADGPEMEPPRMQRNYFYIGQFGMCQHLEPTQEVI